MSAEKNRVNFDQIKAQQASRFSRPGAPKVVFNVVKEKHKLGFGPKPLLSQSARRAPKGEIQIEAYLHHHVESGQRKRWECDSIIAFAKHPKVNLPYASEKTYDAMVKIHDKTGIKGWEDYKKAAASVAKSPESKEPKANGKSVKVKEEA